MRVYVCICAGLSKLRIKRLKQVRFVGGGALSDVTCQILADCTGRTVETVESPQNVGAVGAAVVIAVGLGLIDDLAQAKPLIPASRTFMPNPENRAAYDKNYGVYKKLYKANRECFRALNS